MARRHPIPQPDPACALCSKPITSGSLVLFQYGELFHVPCVSRAHQLGAMDGVGRARAIRAKLAETTQRTTQLIDRLRRLEIGLCAECRRPLWQRSGPKRTGGYLRRSDGKPVHLECPPPQRRRQPPGGTAGGSAHPTN